MSKTRDAAALTAAPNKATIRLMRIAVVSSHDPNSVYAFSGTCFFAIRALARKCDELTCYVIQPRAGRLQFWASDVRQRLTLMRLGARRIRTVFVEPEKVADLARYLQRRPAQAVFTFVFWDPRLKQAVGVPTLFSSDATFRGYEEVFSRFLSGSSAAERSKLDAEEREAILSADQCVYSSAWAAESAVRHYGKDPQRVAVVHYGPNLIHTPSRQEVLAQIGAKPSRTPTILVFGKGDYARFKDKMGPLIDVVGALRQRIPTVRIQVVGFHGIPEGVIPDFVDLKPFIDKTSQHGCRAIAALYAGADVFVLPTKADCTPIVLCEAMAFGLPIVSHRVGGIADYVVEGKNGYLLAPDSPVQAYVDTIERILTDRARYAELATSSRTMYEEEYNWDQYGARVLKLARGMVSK